MQASKVNGLDVEALQETCHLLEAKPELGKSQFRVTNQWKSGGHNQIAVRGFYAAGEEDASKGAPF